MFSRINSYLSSIHGKCMLFGMLLAWLPIVLAGPAMAWDFSLRNVGSFGRRVVETIETLAGIKQGLDSNVRALGQDAKNLVGDADNLIEIKNKLGDLAQQTQSQINEINALVEVVEGHLKNTEENIAKTARNVARIDEVRSALQGRR